MISICKYFCLPWGERGIAQGRALYTHPGSVSKGLCCWRQKILIKFNKMCDKTRVFLSML
jgi:hypothetical protein